MKINIFKNLCFGCFAKSVFGSQANTPATTSVKKKNKTAHVEWIELLPKPFYSKKKEKWNKIKENIDKKENIYIVRSHNNV